MTGTGQQYALGNLTRDGSIAPIPADIPALSGTERFDR